VFVSLESYLSRHDRAMGTALLQETRCI